MAKENLQEELRKLDKQIQEIRAKEAMTKEDVDKLNALCDQVEGISARIEAEERAGKLTADLSKPTELPPGLGQPDQKRQGFASFGEYLQAVARASTPSGMQIGGAPTGQIDRRLLYMPEERAGTGLEEGTPSLGGFLVQQDFAAELFRLAHDTSIVWSRVRQIPISANSNSLKMNAIDETSRADGSRLGGIRMYWTEEAGAKTASMPKFRKMELTLKKLTGLCYATDELLADAAALGAVITSGFAEEAGFKLDEACINGTGAGQPQGILSANCLISVAKETGQAASTILWDNIKKMWARLWPRSATNFVVLINQDTMPQLMSMSMPVGTGGVPVWLPAGGAVVGPFSQLMGRPVIPIEQAATLGTVGDIIFADLSQYLAITKGGLQAASSMHVRFVYDEMTFRFVFRVDGQPLWNAALTPYKGSATQGPFVVLATRS